MRFVCDACQDITNIEADRRGCDALVDGRWRFAGTNGSLRNGGYMKETDIVQALRCCAEGECKDCAMHEDKQRCQENLLDKAAEAIERLTAENAALRETKFGLAPGSITRPQQSWRYVEEDT